MTVKFRLVREDETDNVHRWHREFQARDDAIYPRTAEEFAALVDAGALWLAEDENQYLGLAYADFDPGGPKLEIGGLMVEEAARNRGVGTTLMRLALGQALQELNILDKPDARVVAHVLKSNPKPRRIIEDHLKFHWVSDVELPGSEMRGLRADDDGIVRGDEFEFTSPDSIQSMYDWAAGWDGYLPNGEMAHLELTSNMTPRTWAEAFRDMLESKR